MEEYISAQNKRMGEFVLMFKIFSFIREEN